MKQGQTVVVESAAVVVVAAAVGITFGFERIILLICLVSYFSVEAAAAAAVAVERLMMHCLPALTVVRLNYFLEVHSKLY